ncbi:RPAP1-like protein [Podospora aff. communis PSN243]|uniref:RPAP1-like protein n=1 Tax=Podospora aff. communis PSN243 TaxID=3040156 RepID=A0AAV9G9C0_9PEZI|nr:RPAP1-like protein [Podospora aff. communis PSN243]
MESTVQIFDVKERTVGEVKAPSFPTPPSSTANGFPAHKKRTSAFKQRRRAAAAPDPSPKLPQTVAGPSSKDGARPNDDPIAAERRTVDKENQGRLALMSPEEIMEAQQELFSSLDPDLIQMLLRRSNLDDRSIEVDVFNTPSADRPPTSEPPRIKVEDTSKEEKREDPGVPPTKPENTKPKKTVTFDEDSAPSVPPADLLPTSEPPLETKLTDAHSHSHDSTHFPPPPSVPDLDPADPNFLENLHKKYFPSLPADPSRLAWMAPIPTEGSLADQESPYYPGQASVPVSALRFDFHGMLLTPNKSRQIPVSKGLHHHGEAPEAAGYTIPELARLARSAVPGQRCIAYQTLGRVLYRLGKGEWGTGSGGRGGDEDDLAFGLWRCIQEGRILETLGEEASQEEGKGHISAKAFATEALWLFEKGGWKEKWRGR